MAALFDMGVPIVVVATKTDKLSATQLTSALVTIRDGLGLPEGQPFSVSSVTGRGVKELWKIIMEACEERVMEYRKEKLKDASDPWYSDDGFDAENEEEVGYDMGYDWVHDSQSVMYEGDSTDHATQSGGQYHDGENAEYYDEGYDGDDGYYDDEDLDGDEYYDDASNMESKPMTIQSLRKKAKEMEKQGKV
uniref:Uncharacterized protein n=1 Tax=Craspedostauros australis TaxID=1486917 RepID=A0A7R9WU90_9STRA